VGDWPWRDIDAEDVIQELGSWWVPEECREHLWEVQDNAMGSRYRCKTCSPR